MEFMQNCTTNLIPSLGWSINSISSIILIYFRPLSIYWMAFSRFPLCVLMPLDIFFNLTEIIIGFTVASNIRAFIIIADYESWSLTNCAMIRFRTNTFEEAKIFVIIRPIKHMFQQNSSCLFVKIVIC